MNVKDTEIYSRALALATEKHKGQLRTGGLEYITHPIAVADILEGWGYGEKAVISGIFHDLLEDTDATEDEIEAIGGREVLSAVRLLTKTKGYLMEDYVSEIKKSPWRAQSRRRTVFTTSGPQPYAPPNLKEDISGKPKNTTSIFCPSAPTKCSRRLKHLKNPLPIIERPRLLKAPLRRL